jgi:UDP-N-acetylmuramyl pentapeptide phosphotransferase/UDP-N-acetylglucosamine-1-phosphate transferase
MKELLLDFSVISIFAGVLAFLMSSSSYLYPVIINVSKAKGLMDTPDSRKMHVIQTPTLGGLGVFLAFSLSIIGFGLVTDMIHADLNSIIALLGSLIILLFLGMKDDLLAMSPKKKFLGQLLAVAIVVLLSDIRILNFDGLLGIGELPYVVSVLFTFFVFILVINAINLIDGIDGLAGSISVVASVAFGAISIVHGNYLMTLIASVFIGSTIGFLRYNFSSNQKIFMGDCGSMLAGFILTYQAIYFLNLNNTLSESSVISNTPVILVAILSYPLFDLLRVFIIRIRQGKSPFEADSNHIHHRLLRLGFEHKHATFILVLGNALVISFAILLSSLNIHLHLMITVLFGSAIYLIPFLKVFEIEPEVVKDSEDKVIDLNAIKRIHEFENILEPFNKMEKETILKNHNKTINLNKRKPLKTSNTDAVLDTKEKSLRSIVKRRQKIINEEQALSSDVEHIKNEDLSKS